MDNNNRTQGIVVLLTLNEIMRADRPMDMKYIYMSRKRSFLDTNYLKFQGSLCRVDSQTEDRADISLSHAIGVDIEAAAI